MRQVLGRIEAVLCGRARAYTRPGTSSAIDKQAIDGPVAVSEAGMAGDEQGDPLRHGGVDKAVHHYPFEHYEPWRRELGPHPLLGWPGGFGENLSSAGLTEAQVCFGDRLRIGSVLLEVSQTRQPCWKLNDRFAVADMALRVQRARRTGWYYRVIEPGAVQAGDRVVLEARSFPLWPLPRVMDALYGRSLDGSALRRMLDLPLTASWRGLVERRLERNELEDWSARLEGPGFAPAVPVD